MKQPIVIAHRGASGYVPEHTLMAKGIAHAMGADFIEQDVVLSKDGIPIVLHDVQVDTVTDVAKKFPERRRDDGRFYAIDLTLDELKTLNVYERFDRGSGQAVFAGRYPTGEGEFRIVTLAEEIRFIQNLNRSTGREAGIYPEIKRPVWHREHGKDLSRAVLDVIAKYGYASKVDLCYVQCFDSDEVVAIRGRYGYQGRLIQLIGEGYDEESDTDYNRLKSREGLAGVAEIADGIGPSLNDIFQCVAEGEVVASDLTDAAHSFGLQVHPWTFRSDGLPKNVPSNEFFFDACFQTARIDGLFADQPDMVVSYLRSRTEKGS
ncbi:glycerophosphodiester phosphodiesterase [Aporhodopirellula aestuarii]|uniref:glycerophosphodiester phosphodiesterase n=1 Tax=Aporhodopirellula aestuarii TaxID=2950107 RepID=A0ABT0U3L6_9BACT|nr:glycerophosphodiester phosphodiesterase [Aporhodopirellula aestuarii]MCM2371406.1 glycerophosphodiester phosphodiesterase [Aporhodopirellula aestuarii]